MVDKTPEWRMSVAGLSSDLRTNRWRITPPCGHAPFEPRTTMLAVQHVACPRCGRKGIAFYNQRTIREDDTE